MKAVKTCTLCANNENKERRVFSREATNVCAECLDVCNQLAASAAGKESTLGNRQCSVCSASFQMQIMNENRHVLCADCLMQFKQAAHIDRILHRKQPIRYASSEEKKEYFDTGMSILLEGQLDEYSGELIANMLELDAREILVAYARKWLSLFAAHDAAPILVAEWLKSFPTDEAVELAAQYLKMTPMCRKVFYILRVVLAADPAIETLDHLVLDLLEREPKSAQWSGPIASRCANGRTEALALRWLELNKDNPDLYVMDVTALVSSAPVIEKLFECLSAKNRTKYYTAMSLGVLLQSASKFHKAFVPTITDFARVWISQNWDDEDNGWVISELILASGSAADIQTGKDWYAKHKASSCAWLVLSGMLKSSYARGEKADDFAIEQTKLELSSNAHPALAKALLQASEI